MEKLIKILEEIRPEFDFKNEGNFVDSGMLDSFDIITLVSDIEEQFSVTISGIDVVPENFNNLSDILRLIERSKQN